MSPFVVGVSIGAFVAGAAATTAFLAARQPTPGTDTGNRDAVGLPRTPQVIGGHAPAPSVRRSPTEPQASDPAATILDQASAAPDPGLPLIVGSQGGRPVRIIPRDDPANPYRDRARAPGSPSIEDGPYPEPHTPDEIAAALDRIALPPSGPDAPTDYVDRRDAALEQMASLGLRLYDADPNHSRAAPAMRRRWESLTNALGRAAEALDEAGRLEKSANPDIRREATYARARAAIALAAMPRPELDALIESAIDAIGPSDRTAALLLELATTFSANPDEQRAIAQRVEDGFGPPAGPLGLRPKDARRLADLAGRTLGLSFTDALSGRSWSLEEHAGRPVLLALFPNLSSPPDGFDPPEVMRTLLDWTDRGLVVAAIHDRPSPAEMDLLRRIVPDPTTATHDIAHMVETGSPWETYTYTVLDLNHRPAWVLIGPDGQVRCASYGLRAMGPEVERALDP